jgi:hypothetical protein
MVGLPQGAPPGLLGLFPQERQAGVALDHGGSGAAQVGGARAARARSAQR